MKKKVKIFFLGLLVFVSSSALSKTYSDFSHPIVVKSDDPEVEIQLPETSGTGYQWVVTHYDHHLLTPEGQENVSRQTNKPGASSAIIFKFEIKKTAFVISQQTQINLQYLRPWETKPGNELSIKIIIEHQ
jgi:predicted secreted protein